MWPPLLASALGEQEPPQYPQASANTLRARHRLVRVCQGVAPGLLWRPPNHLAY